MNIIESLEWRYATKKFDATKSLSTAQIDTLIQAFNLTATSYGLQPLKLVVIHNKDLQQQLVAHSMNQQQVADASHLLVICIEKEISSDYIINHFERVKAIRNTDDEVLKPFRDYLIDSFGGKSTTEIRTWASKQAYIALGNLLTVCATQEIDACPMEGFVPEKYDEVLQLDKKGLSSILVLPVGYRSNEDMFADFAKVRRSTEDTVIQL